MVQSSGNEAQWTKVQRLFCLGTPTSLLPSSVLLPFFLLLASPLSALPHQPLPYPLTFLVQHQILSSQSSSSQTWAVMFQLPGDASSSVHKLGTEQTQEGQVCQTPEQPHHSPRVPHLPPAQPGTTSPTCTLVTMIPPGHTVLQE